VVLAGTLSKPAWSVRWHQLERRNRLHGQIDHVWRQPIGALLWKTVKRSGENYLRQLSGSKMDIIETICRKPGINCEEAVREAVVAALSRQASQDQNPRTDELPDWDKAD
jgi:hypothetical protein